jgi:hypothetical protein
MRPSFKLSISSCKLKKKLNNNKNKMNCYIKGTKGTLKVEIEKG